MNRLLKAMSSAYSVLVVLPLEFDLDLDLDLGFESGGGEYCVFAPCGWLLERLPEMECRFSAIESTLRSLLIEFLDGLLEEPTCTSLFRGEGGRCEMRAFRSAMLGTP